MIEHSEESFHWVESLFLRKWWDQANEMEKKNLYKIIHETKQLEVLMGGWVMTDQASTTYSSVIMEMTQGHLFLKDKLDVKTEFGWSIDPFGHSSFLVDLYKQMGIKNHVVNRISKEMKEEWRKDKKLEFYWGDSKMFTKVMYDSYSPGQPYLWFGGFPDPEGPYDPVLNPPMNPETVNKTAWIFKNDVMRRIDSVLSDEHVLFPFGNDFWYSNPDVLFGNMTYLMKYINSNQEIFHLNVKYSKLSDYFNAIKKEKHDFPSYDGDFFPYNDCDNDCYWTGYFVSNPLIKIYHRIGERILRTSDQLSVISQIEGNKVEEGFYDSLDLLRNKISQINHHDSITGTEKLYVEKFFIKQLQTEIDKVIPFVEKHLSSLLMSKRSENIVSHDLSTLVGQDEYYFGLLFYNNLGWKRSNAHADIIVDGNGKYTITDSSGKEIKFSYLTFFKDEYHIYFPLSKIAPLGYITYYIRKEKGETAKQLPRLIGNEYTSISNEYYELIFDESSGKPTKIKNIKEGFEMDVGIDFYYYESLNDFSVAHCTSGAYIFRSKYDHNFQVTEKASIYEINKNDHFEEARVSYSDYINLVFRLYSSDNRIEIFYEIGELPVDNEVVIKISTKIKNKNKIFIDELGYSMKEKVFDPKKRLEGNYFPSVYKTNMHDDKHQVIFIADKAQSVGLSGNEGEFYVMVHRRTSSDDLRGRGEPLNDNSTIYFRSYLLLNEVNSKTSSGNKNIYDLNYPVDIFLIKKPKQMKRKAFDKFQSLDKNVHLLSLEKRKDDIIVRMNNIHTDVDQVESMNLNDFFQDYDIKFIAEKNLDLTEDIDNLIYPNDNLNLGFKRIRNFKISMVSKDMNLILLWIFLSIFFIIVVTILIWGSVIIYSYFCKNSSKDYIPIH